MLAALEVQGRVIKALFLREMKTRFGDKRLGIFMAFIEPMIHVMVFIAIWKIVGRMGPHGVDPVLFLITGIIPFIMFSNIMNKVSKSVAANRALIVFPQIKVIDFVISRIVVELVTYASVLLIFVLMLPYFGYDFRVEFALGVATKFILMALLGGGVGYVLLPLNSMFGFTEYIVKFMQRFLYFTSGVFFAIERLPQEASSYVQWNPVLHIMHMLRADFFPQMPLKPEFSNLYFVYFLIPVLWIMGMTMTKKFMKYILEDR